MERNNIEDTIEAAHNLPTSVDGERVVKDMQALIAECRKLRHAGESKIAVCSLTRTEFEEALIKENLGPTKILNRK